jgi:hypothetical protein
MEMKTKISIGEILDRFYRIPGAVVPCFFVPERMRIGEWEPDVGYDWKILPGWMTEDDRSDLEKRVGPIPDSFWEYLSSRCQLFGEMHMNNGISVVLPITPVDAPLKDFCEQLEQYEQMIYAGYLPIGSYEDGAGPVCLDLENSSSRDDAPVVVFDGEILPEDIHLGRPVSRNALEPLAQCLSPSFRSLVEELFSSKV